MLGIEKPLPNPTEDSEGYWEAARKNQLVVSGCGDCGHKFLPPAKLCPCCLSEKVAFTPVSGKGRVFSWIVVHRPQHPAFFPDAPYNVAIVELDEGPRMHARMVDFDRATMKVGMPVEVVFEKIDAEITLPMFRAAK